MIYIRFFSSFHSWPGKQYDSHKRIVSIMNTWFLKRKGGKRERRKRGKTLVIWKFRLWCYNTKKKSGCYRPSAHYFEQVVYFLSLPKPCVVDTELAAAASHRSQKWGLNFVPRTHLLPRKKNPHIPDCTVWKFENDTNVHHVKSCPLCLKAISQILIMNKGGQAMI